MGRILERSLPDDAAVLGLDEHTAAVLDAGADLVRVRGRGALTVRWDGTSTTVPAGEAITLADRPGRRPVQPVPGRAAARADRRARRPPTGLPAPHGPDAAEGIASVPGLAGALDGWSPAPAGQLPAH